MNPSDMINSPSGWMDGGLVIWTVLAIVIGVLLVLVFSKLFKKKD